MEAAAYFRRRKLVPERLIGYGFTHRDGVYQFSTTVMDGQFQLSIAITDSGVVDTKMMDTASNEEYVLHRVPGASGAFVGAVKEAYESILLDIAERCFEADVFKSQQANAIIHYVRQTYGDELEYLWKQFPDNAVWRRKDTRKWYGALLTVSKRKLGINSDEVVEVIDLRADPNKMDSLIDHVKYFPGWHMNKKSWITMILDGSVPLVEMEARINESYRLAVK